MGLMSGVKGVLIDAWSWLNYKPVFSDQRGMPARRAFPEAQATWVPATDERRLAAYKLLAAYLNNQAAEYAAVIDPDASERREYGDPSQFVDTIQANVLGDEQTIVVPGAEDADTDTGTGDPEAQRAALVQERLRDWAEAEQLAMRIQQGERKAVSMGDGVYLLAWDPAKRRVTVRAKDPGFFFPVLPEDGDGEFPDRVHFAWDLPEDPARNLPARLRRITYELGPIGPATAAGVNEAGRAIRAPLTVEDPATGDLLPVVGPGDTVDPDTGTVSRLYPWNDEPSTVTCYLTEAVWDISDLKGPNLDVDNLPMDKAQYVTRSDGEVLDHLDLLIDFVPVVHVPNTVPEAEEYWGTSSLAKVLQVFDELQGSDTDTARASATTGLPIVGVSGIEQRGDMMVEPGQVWTLGENGKLTTVDTSSALRELRAHVDGLTERAARVARLPAVSLGTVDPSKVPSGYAMDVSMGPLDSLIGSMRLARRHKYALLLKMVQRLHIAGQHPDWIGLRPMPATLVFGAYKPTDRAGVLEQVANGVEKSVLSLETAVRMLMDAGFPIDDAVEEIQRIQSRSFAQARALADALGNTDEVADYLGRKAPDPGDAPTPNLPPAGGDDDGLDDLEDSDETTPEGSRGNPS